MRRWGVARPGTLPRRALLALTLAGHLFATFGVPLFVSSPKESAPTYPCQSRPCGCLSAAECWAGDCCCFTMEEKLAWAEANGVEPPPHVRPMVESRKARQAAEERPSCCEESAPCCADEEPVPSHRWVIGTFAGRCRATDPAALEEKPSVPPAPAAPAAAPVFLGYVPAVAVTVTAVVTLPEAPPPRP
jgi:hypothetical protein